MSNGRNIIQRGRLALSPETLTHETVGGTTIQSSLPYVADLDQFKVTVQKEGNDWCLRVNKGVVEFQRAEFDDTAFDFSSGVRGKVITDFNVYPTGSKVMGTGGNQSQGVEQNGHVKIDSGSNYFVFIYTINPAWSTSGSTDINNPQLVVCKESDDPNYIYYNWQCGGGFVSPYLEQTITNVTVEGTSGTTSQRFEQNTLYQVYRQIDCARHNIAHVIWDATKGWQIRQLQVGPCVLQNHPMPGKSLNFQTIDGVPQAGQYIWDPSTYGPYVTSQSSIAGYDKHLTNTGLFGLTDTSPTGTQYLKPT